MKRIIKDDEVMIVSELSKDLPEDDDEFFTDRQAKIVVIIMSLAVITIAAISVIFASNKKTNLDRQESEIRTKIAEEKEQHDELLERADELCNERIENYTSNSVLDLGEMLESYKYSTSDHLSWTSGDDEILFDITSSGDSVIRFSSVDSGSFVRKTTASRASGDYSCILGQQMLYLSNEDMKALGRLLVGSTDGFQKK